MPLSSPTDSPAAPRIAASVNFAGVVVAVVLAAVFMPGMPRDMTDTVRLADAPPQSASLSCTDQVWPHIDARCLKRADAPAKNSAAPNARPASSAADAALSPLTITPVRPPGPSVPVENAAPVVAAPPAQAVAPASPPAQTAQTQPASDFSRTYTAGAAVEDDVEAEEGAADVPMPPRPKKHSGHHRQFNPFGFLGIRF
jgi:hypothetical protein